MPSYDVWDHPRAFLIDKSNAGKIHIDTSGINYIIVRLPAATHFDQPLSCCLMFVDEHQGNIVYGKRENSQIYN